MLKKAAESVGITGAATALGVIAGEEGTAARAGCVAAVATGMDGAEDATKADEAPNELPVGREGATWLAAGVNTEFKPETTGAFVTAGLAMGTPATDEKPDMAGTEGITLAGAEGKARVLEGGMPMKVGLEVATATEAGLLKTGRLGVTATAGTVPEMGTAGTTVACG